MKCKICNEKIIGKRNNAQYCLDCSKKRRRNNWKQWYESKGREWVSRVGGGENVLPKEPPIKTIESELCKKKFGAKNP